MFSTQKAQLSIFLCLCMCLGIGIFRFSYTALLPVTRESFGWSIEFASLLSSANLLGYLMGAIWAMRLAQTPRMTHFIQGAAIAGSLSLFCCAFDNLPHAWYMFWRIVSGICGGLIMILSPSIVAQCCDVKDRFQINFIGFSGIGIGVLLATLFLPYLDQISAQSAWLILTVFATLISCILMVYLKRFRSQLSSQVTVTSSRSELNLFFFSLLTVYGASAFAYVPHSLFWIDYLTEVLKLDLYWINMNWILYGFGSALGAFCSYLLAKRFGNIHALKILYSSYVFAIIIALFDQQSIFTFLSSFLTGLLNPAVVFLTSYTLLQRYTAAYKQLWSIATILFATVQLIGGLSFSGLQILGVSYHQQFALAAFILLLGTLQFFWITRKEQQVKMI